MPDGRTRSSYRHHDLAHNNINQHERRHQFDALLDIQTTTLDLINLAIDREKVGLAQLDRIRRDDIWPTWGTLSTASNRGWHPRVLLGRRLCRRTDHRRDQPVRHRPGAALGVATECLPKPTPDCARALTLGAASVSTDRLTRAPP